MTYRTWPPRCRNWRTLPRLKMINGCITIRFFCGIFICQAIADQMENHEAVADSSSSSSKETLSATKTTIMFHPRAYQTVCHSLAKLRARRERRPQQHQKRPQQPLATTVDDAHDDSSASSFSSLLLPNDQKQQEYKSTTTRDDPKNIDDHDDDSVASFSSLADQQRRILDYMQDDQFVQALFVQNHGGGAAQPRDIANLAWKFGATQST
jgi:hypothetical protein